LALAEMNGFDINTNFTSYDGTLVNKFIRIWMRIHFFSR